MATRRITKRLCLTIIFFLFYNASPLNAKGTKYVTYNSVFKLVNEALGVRLHSHDIKYGTGSGQQSVTGNEAKEDGNSYWMVKAETGKTFTRGKPIACGETIRLEHVGTKKNLHSHHVPSPLSGKQEVSAYGDSKGEGDTGDHWVVVCDTEFWERGKSVALNHVDTNGFLSVTKKVYGSLISGQIEVVADYAMIEDFGEWKAMEGMFIHSSDLKTQHYEHTEL